jgi:hypothetical protein
MSTGAIDEHACLQRIALIKYVHLLRASCISIVCLVIITAHDLRSFCGESGLIDCNVTMATPMHGVAETPAYTGVIEDEGGMDEMERQLRANMQAQARAKESLPDEDDGANAMARSNRIIDRETEYQKRRLQRGGMTPARIDAYAMGDQTPDASIATYADTLRRAQLNREADNTYRNIQLKEREEASAVPSQPQYAAEPAKPAASRQRRNRWGEAPPGSQSSIVADTPARSSFADATPARGGLGDATPAYTQRWDATPAPNSASDATPAHISGSDTPAAHRWDATPAAPMGATPKRNRWDATPAAHLASAAPPAMTDQTPGRKRSRFALLHSPYNPANCPDICTCNLYNRCPDVGHEITPLFIIDGPNGP